MKSKVVLAYSGGLDTSVSVKWIQQNYNADVITMTIDVGQKADLVATEKRAIEIGAVKHYSIDARKEFAEDYVFKAIKANGRYERKYPLSTSLSRPLIASKLVEVAKKEGAVGVAHGCTGKGNDQVRFEVTIKALAPDLKIIAPIREWGLSRDEELDFARKNNISVPKSNSLYSIDQNLWGRSVECGILENPESEPPADAFEITTQPEKTPDKPEYLTIGFEKGVPIKINKKKLNSLDIIEELNLIAGKNGVGRIDHIEDRVVGIKSREVYECPAATLILEAHEDLEKMVLTHHELAFKRSVEDQWSYMVYAGLWMDPLKDALESFIDKTQERVEGEVKLKLYKGSVMVIGRSSPMSLYNIDLATYGSKTTFDQNWSKGFIEIYSSQTVIANNLIRSEKAKIKK